MRHFLIITNIYKDKNRRLTDEIASYITERGGSCVTYMSAGESIADATPDISAIPDNTECVIVLGGDGTLIRAASGLVGSRLPIIGVNLGKMGYLCELEENSVFEAIDELMHDRYIIEERMMLRGYHGESAFARDKATTNVSKSMVGNNATTPTNVAKDAVGNNDVMSTNVAKDAAGNKATTPTNIGGAAAGVTSRTALNDIVIHRTGALTVINLLVYVNGEYLNRFQADGIIISTPTGSTGYNMSAGGPIVDPKANLILLTPINSHDLTSRSIVIGADDEVVVEIGEKRTQKDEMIVVSFDGDNAEKLVVGDRFVISKASDTARICRLNRRSFLENLAKKLQA
jgi:NAD+ kinase